MQILRRKDDPELESFESALVGAGRARRRHHGLGKSLADAQSGRAKSRRRQRARQAGDRRRRRASASTAIASGCTSVHCSATATALLAGRVDAMIAPASPGPAPLWPGDTPGQPLLPRPTGDPVFNYPSSLLGAPVVTSPLTAVRGLPMGIQLMGQPGADARDRRDRALAARRGAAGCGVNSRFSTPPRERRAAHLRARASVGSGAIGGLRPPSFRNEERRCFASAMRSEWRGGGPLFELRSRYYSMPTHCSLTSTAPTLPSRRRDRASPAACLMHDGQPKTRRLFCPTSQARLAKIYSFRNTEIMI